jgi:mutator protein MutT
LRVREVIREASSKAVEVALALVVRGEKILVAKRQEGAHLSGYWEFPGGKIRPDETPEEAAVREVREETGVVARAVARRAPIEWSYPERSVRLHPIDCTWLEGDGTPRQVAELRWVTFAELSSLRFPDANGALVTELASTRRPT